MTRQEIQRLIQTVNIYDVYLTEIELILKSEPGDLIPPEVPEMESDNPKQKNISATTKLLGKKTKASQHPIEEKSLTEPPRKRKKCNKSEEENPNDYVVSHGRKSKGYVILGTGLTKQVINKLRKTVNKLGGEFADDMSSGVTHLLTGTIQSKCAKRTVKYFYSILAGIWILDLEWINRCEKVNAWVDEEPFEILSDTQDVGAPKKGRLRSQNKLPGLFHSTSFIMYGAFKSMDCESLKQLIKVGEGKLVKENECGNDTIVLVDGACNKEKTKLVKKKFKRQPVKLTWFLDCVSAYKLLPMSEYKG
eukprot:TRINITY_DN11408_c0_g1_i1.p1 TRINITY_DN11408_c0_g1~~TRINITY_DN11408_c0_g1_i1.p1  ORF type:complete len:306 (-),score=41.68 TRINITY_DN11408_c0_g1_i1:52-969(-)